MPTKTKPPEKREGNNARNARIEREIKEALKREAEQLAKKIKRMYELRDLRLQKEARDDVTVANTSPQ